MNELGEAIREALAALDSAHDVPDGQVPRAMKLYSAALVGCRVLEWFLRIHPFANGNGHVARLMVTAILGRYGYWPRRWTIDPNPQGALPYYDDYAAAFREPGVL
jgi:hypothetical protein